MQYISTRGEAPALGFIETIMTGLASDGGLYLPEKFPQLSFDALRALRGQSYMTIAKTILWPFVNNEIEYTSFENMISESYATFHHPATCPLLQTGPNEFILELFHGPTLAFKDVAMQFLSRLMDYVLIKKINPQQLLLPHQVIQVVPQYKLLLEENIQTFLSCFLKGVYHPFSSGK